MKAHHIVEKRFLDASLFMFICGLWCYLDSGFYQMYGEHGAVGMVLSFYATDLVDMKDYEDYLVNKEFEAMSFKELQASLIQLFHNDRVHPDSLIHNGIGKKELLEILVEMKKRMSH